MTRTLATAAMIAALASPLAAQQNCAPRAVVLESLQGKYGETRQMVGLAASGQFMELFASNETGSWTITITLPNGLTCLVASGQSFESVYEVIPKGDPT